MSARAGHPSREGSWALSLAILGTVLVAASGIGLLLAGFEWFLLTALVAVLVAVAPAFARAVGAPAAVPPLVGVAVLVGSITALFLPAGALLGVLPTVETIAQIERLSGEAGRSIAQQGLPAVADSGITFLIASGVGAIVWLFDTLVFTFRTPALAGVLPLLLLAVPSIIDPSSLAWFALVGAMVGFLTVLGADSRFRARLGRRNDDPVFRVRRRESLVVASVVVVASLAFSAAAPGFVRQSPSAGAGDGPIFSGGIDPIIALGNNLRRPNPVTVLRYTTTASSPTYLRVLTLDTFTGQEWAPTDPGDGTAGDLEAFPAPAGLTDGITRTSVDTTVDITALRSRWLPLPYPSTSVDGVTGDWGVDPSDLTVSGGDETRRDDLYTATSYVLAPSEDQLRAAPAASTQFDEFRALPAEVPEVVSETARTVTADAGTDYDRAVALQRYFRGPEFSYSERAPVREGYDGDGVDVLAEFLEAKSGYCVHYASAMTVMARELGIPARIAVGYQPGTLIPGDSDDEGQTFRVSSSDLHAWPELYFEGAGWLPFEPTPSRGSPAGYTLPSTSGSADPSSPGATASAEPVPGAEQETATAVPTATPTSQAGATGTAGGDSSVALWWLLALVALGAIPAIVRAVQRSLRLRRLARGDDTAVWDEIVATAVDLGVAVDPGASPLAATTALAGSVRTDAARAALDRVRARLELLRFARPVGGGAAHPLSTLSTDVLPTHALSTRALSTDALSTDELSAVTDALRAAAPGGQRVLAAVLPRSIGSVPVRGIAAARPQPPGSAGEPRPPGSPVENREPVGRGSK